MAKVFLYGKELDPAGIAFWANKIHKEVAKGKGTPYTRWDFYQSGDFGCRLRGDMCDCGVDEKGFSKGEFDLLPDSDESVKSGMKAYMVCRKCKAYSHL